MRRGGRPAQGGTPATLAHRWPGHWQARPPHVGGLPPCAGLALALPAGATAGTPARRRRSLRPAAREARGRRRLRRQCARRSKLRPPAGARAAASARSRGPGSAGGRHPQRGARAATPGGECVGRAARHGLRRRRGRAGKAGRSAADRAGGADGPKAPIFGGRAAPEHLRRDRRGGGAKQGPPQAACLGLALRRGAPAQRLAANLTRTRRRRGLGRHITPARPARAGRGGRRPRRRPGWAGCRPAGRRGGWDVARPQAGRGREPLSPGR